MRLTPKPLSNVSFSGNAEEEKWRYWPKMVHASTFNFYQTALINPALERFIRVSAPPHGNVMDAGCGEGQHSRILSAFPNVKAVTAQDKSAMLLKDAAPADKIRYVQGSVTRLKAEDESLDQLYSIMTLMYVRNVNQALKEAYRVLKPGGDFVMVLKHPFALWQEGSAKEQRAYFDKRIVTSDILPPQYPRTVSDILNRASQAGFIYVNSVEPMPDKAISLQLPEKSQKTLERWNQEPYCWMIHFKKPKSIEFFV